MIANRFKGKKIAILGLSIEGLSSLNFFLKQQSIVSIFDQKKISEFPKEIIKLLKEKKTNFFLGKNYRQRLFDQDLIIRTPGFPLWDKKLQEVKEAGAEIASQTKIFFDLCPGKIIGITGTKGKGTTSTLIYQLLKDSGFDAYLGGNIGNPSLDFLHKLNTNSVVVLELSSFQLEDLTKSPHISVILNIASDHLFSSSFENPNYHLSQEKYYQAKTNIVRFQSQSDYVVINHDYLSSQKFTKLTKAKAWYFSHKQKINNGAYVMGNNIYFNKKGKTYWICSTSKVVLLGKHNLENILAAITASFLAGVSLFKIPKTITSFRGLEHRLEFVRDYQGVKYYNDSFSTTPETAIAALHSFANPLILICGGSEKGSDYTLLGEEIVKKPPKNVILIGITGEKIENSIKAAGKKLKMNIPTLTKGFKNMSEIVNFSHSIGQKGDVVLLSPASASFDMFKSYKERGNLFKQAVNSL